MRSLKYSKLCLEPQGSCVRSQCMTCSLKNLLWFPKFISHWLPTSILLTHILREVSYLSESSLISWSYPVCPTLVFYSLSSYFQFQALFHLTEVLLFYKNSFPLPHKYAVTLPFIGYFRIALNFLLSLSHVSDTWHYWTEST